MNRNEFFNVARKTLGPLNSSQVEGFDLVLNEMEKRRVPIHDGAYYLATSWWESGNTMKPVREAFYVSQDPVKAEAWRKRKLRYYPYYGRGLVQLTWVFNYRKASDFYGVDLVKDPDLALNPVLSINIMFDGMEQGWFTTKKLDDYIDDIDESDDEDLREYINARRIVNGTDKARDIGNLALMFEKALKAAKYTSVLPPPPPPSPPPPPPSSPPQPDDPGPVTPDQPVNILVRIIQAIVALFRRH